MSRTDSAVSILHRDARIVVISKPPGLAAIPGRGETSSVIGQLAEMLKLPFSGTDDPRLRVVHRLDKDTSGVMVYALDLEAQRALSHQFQNNTIHKEYLALVAGQPAEDQGEIDDPIGVHPASTRRMAVVKHGGRPARTLWRVERRFANAALLRVLPRTGKTHQIRVHLLHAGMPLLIDPLYNNARGASAPGLMLSAFKRGYRPAGDAPERPLINRLTLHAEVLRLDHPDGASMAFQAPVPRDLRAAINMLTKYARR
jgi:RluA family pseudouridine synthase